MKNKICGTLATLVAVCIIYISTFDVVVSENVSREKEIKYVDSKVLSQDVIRVEENASEEIEENVNEEIKTEVLEEVIVEVKQEVKKEEKVEKEVPVVKEEVQKDVVSENEVLTGGMSGYGPDCRGCSGYLAYGMYVGDGTIYYNDSKYGKVRIVAGDKKYKFGTIVRINDSMLAIVLDRGGAIGIGKKFLFDLLYASEAEASKKGIMKNAKFEILRNGF